MQGVINLSPYSYFNFMSQDPPVLCIGTCSSAPTDKRPSFMKDSQQNIVDTKYPLLPSFSSPRISRSANGHFSHFCSLGLSCRLAAPCFLLSALP